VTTTTNLDRRYGRSPTRRRLQRTLSIVGAALVAVIVVVWAAWVGLLTPGATLSSETISYDIVSDDAVSIQFSVAVDPGNEVVCALAAQSERHAVVGWRIITIPASEERFRTFDEPLITSEPAVVGLISDCRLA